MPGCVFVPQSDTTDLVPPLCALKNCWTDNLCYGLIHNKLQSVSNYVVLYSTNIKGLWWPFKHRQKSTRPWLRIGGNFQKQKSLIMLLNKRSKEVPVNLVLRMAFFTYLYLYEPGSLGTFWRMALVWWLPRNNPVFIY